MTALRRAAPRVARWCTKRLDYKGTSFLANENAGHVRKDRTSERLASPRRKAPCRTHRCDASHAKGLRLRSSPSDGPLRGRGCRSAHRRLLSLAHAAPFILATARVARKGRGCVGSVGQPSSPRMCVRVLDCASVSRTHRSLHVLTSFQQRSHCDD